VEQSTKAAQGAFKTRREDELAPTAELQIEDPAAEARVQQAVGGAIADTLAETAAAEQVSEQNIDERNQPKTEVVINHSPSTNSCPHRSFDNLADSRHTLPFPWLVTQGRWQLRLDEAVSAEQAKAKAAAEAADAATLDAAAAAAKDVAEQERQLETAMRSLAAARDKAMVQSEALAASEAAAKQLGEQAAMAEARVRSVTEELHLSRAVRGDHEEKDSCIKGLVEEGKKLSEQVGHMQKMVREKNAKIEDAEKEAKRLAKERHALAASVDDLTEQLQLLKSQTGDKTKSLAAMQVGE
jgi:archaellum component FlaC